MPRMTEKQYGEKIVKELYSTFKEHPGPNFTWDRFPDIVDRMVRMYARIDRHGKTWANKAVAYAIGWFEKNHEDNVGSRKQPIRRKRIR